jgi:uncharacterized membrane protein YcaP (DUF421 family)
MGFIKPQYMPAEIVVHGHKVIKNLQELGLSESRVKTQIESSGDPVEDIFFAEIQSNETFFIDKRDKNEQQ